MKFFSRFWLLEIQTNCKKLGLEGKFSSALNVFTLSNLQNFQFLGYKENVFTLGRMAQATLVTMSLWALPEDYVI